MARCSCGNVKEVYIYNLTDGQSTNCGCLQNKKNKERMTTHGESKTKLYNVWSGMKRRCYNKNQKSYIDYGARGIRICDEWLNSFEVFRDWCNENGYIESKVEIDRINVDGNYEPSNCRFISKKENARNKRNNTLITIDGETKTISEWSEIKNVSANLIYDRKSRGWSVNDLFVAQNEKGDGRFTEKYVEFLGETVTFEEISKRYNIRKANIIKRYWKGLRDYELVAEVKPRNKPKEVIMFLNEEFINEYKSIKDASQKTGVCKTGISKCCSGKLKTSGGYTWKYKNEGDN